MPTISSGFRPVREAATSTVTPVPPTTASSSRARAPTGRVFSSSAPARPAEIAVTTPVAPSATAWAWASTQQAEMVAMNTQIGRASCREREYLAVVAVAFEKIDQRNTCIDERQKEQYRMYS